VLLRCGHRFSIKPRSLRKGTGKAVEHQASAATKAMAAFANHFPHGRVRREGAFPHKVKGG